MASTNVIQALRNEERAIVSRLLKLDQEKNRLESQREAIRNTTETLSPVLGTKSKTTTTKKRSVKRNTPTMPNKKGPKKASGQLHLAIRRRGPTTMDMVRTVLQNQGGPMKATEIHQAIVRDFGVAPASTLTQMLYKRARAGTGFLRTKDGKYGLKSNGSSHSVPQAA